ncbi:MAG: putative sensor protein [Frankiales bacterium]|nr:putative sensor protein [Frankiales bacterium]
MLLSQEVTQGVEVLSVAGPVGGEDAAVLQRAVARAVDVEPRGVVVDLSDAGPLSAAAVDVLNWATREAGGWPRPALAVCCAPEDLSALLLPAVHGCREEAFAHLDDRPEDQSRVQARVRPGPEGVREARWLAQACADEHGFDGDDLALVVTELVTNAVRHGTPPVELEIDTCEHCVTVVVTDGSADRPRPREAALTDEGGRGLQLVDALAADSGVRAQPPGKAVWAELPRNPSAAVGT